MFNLEKHQSLVLWSNFVYKALSGRSACDNPSSEAWRGRSMGTEMEILGMLQIRLRPLPFRAAGNDTLRKGAELQPLAGRGRILSSDEPCSANPQTY